jgi:hypothetical protein
VLPDGANIARYLPHYGRWPTPIGSPFSVTRASGERLSFAELDRESDRLAWGLRGLRHPARDAGAAYGSRRTAVDQSDLRTDEGRLCADLDRSGNGLA